MMNRIILIGNGFDLAHRLPTSYADFIRGYNISLKLGLLEGEYEQHDGLCSVNISDPEDMKTMERFRWMLHDNMFRYTRNLGEITPMEQYDHFVNDHLTYESKFFEAINKAVESKTWVDIEGEYYSWLKKVFKDKSCEYEDPIRLNEELELIKGALTGYLASVQKHYIKSELRNPDIEQIILEPFSFRDIAVSAQRQFLEFVVSKWAKKNRIELSSEEIKSDKSFAAVASSLVTDWENEELTSKFIEEIKNGNDAVCDEFARPERTLLLNFNYTKTASLYLSANSDIPVNHIHGELDNDKNPVIFGYGDELDEDYKTISNLNDNSYLTNIKSIRYLETDNYRQLLRFTGSAPYQIYIMGHSCGNSDRTLLNTLFEHKNCVSIKPYYYEWTDEEGGHGDNYIEIIQNISRNFNSMQLMRDRVVNKSYCRPLPQKPKVAAIE